MLYYEEPFDGIFDFSLKGNTTFVTKVIDFLSLTRNTGHYWMWKSYSTKEDQKVLALSHLPKESKRIKPEKNYMVP